MVFSAEPVFDYRSTRRGDGDKIIGHDGIDIRQAQVTAVQPIPGRCRFIQGSQAAADLAINHFDPLVVDFLFRAPVALDFLRRHDVALSLSKVELPLSNEALFARASNFVAQIGCWR